VPLRAAAVASTTFRIMIVHTGRGCHDWRVRTRPPATVTVTVTAGTRTEIRPTCPMDFDFAQTAGPKLNLDDRRTYAGSARTIVFRKAGLYKLTATNVQTPEERGLDTLGPTNVLTLTVRVR